MFVGEGEVGGDLPASNGILREGKGSVYEGGIRVDAILSWTGRLKPGEVTGPFHVVDMLPTLAGLAGAAPKPAGPLDGVNFWQTVAAGSPAPRTGIVPNIEPTTGSLRDGDWKLVWTTPLPPVVELFNLKSDPSEKTNVADRHPDIVKRLQDKVIELAKEQVPPYFAGNALQAALSQPPNFPAHLGLAPKAH
jgi:arylsulfatase A-like enzyme